MDWMEILEPIIAAVLTAVAGILGYYIKVGGTQLTNWLKAKVGNETFDNAMKVAEGLYIYLEDKYKDSVEKMGDVKKAEMETLLLHKFPSLTQEELDSINKTIWASFQEGFNGELANTERVDG